jgi:hypothetical protein
MSSLLSEINIVYVPPVELSLLVPAPLKGPVVHTLLGAILAGAAYGFYLFSPLGKSRGPILEAAIWGLGTK